MASLHLHQVLCNRSRRTRSYGDIIDATNVSAILVLSLRHGTDANRIPIVQKDSINLAVNLGDLVYVDLAHRANAATPELTDAGGPVFCCAHISFAKPRHSTNTIAPLQVLSFRVVRTRVRVDRKMDSQRHKHTHESW